MHTQALSYIDLIVQDIDLVTAAQRDIILISHPFTTPDEAKRISKRISSVLQDISFRNTELSDHKDRLLVAHNSVLFDRAEQPERLITRALQNLREDELPRNKPVSAPYLCVVQ